ncbi:MAG: hypothetical protein JRM82_01775 [Nitrososphaerota archaeon]|nr:hypothetical protein [Nitrososphaerota archaeon]MDG7016084.1 hypothetical protein [Nitrososphaerota archaeon]
MKMQGKKRRGVSEIIATLLILAIVVVLGTVVFAFGSAAFANWSEGFGNLIGLKTSQLQESFIVEYVQFNGTYPAQNVVVTVRNVGSITTEVSSIAISNLTSFTGPGSQFLEFSGPSQIAASPPNPTDTNSCSVPAGDNYFVVGVGYSCSFKVDYTWVSGTAYNIVVSTARGNTVTLFWKA